MLLMFPSVRQKSASDTKKQRFECATMEKKQQATLFFLCTVLNPDVYLYCSKGCLSPNALCIDA